MQNFHILQFSHILLIIQSVHIKNRSAILTQERLDSSLLAVEISADLSLEQHILIPGADVCRIFARDIDVGFPSGPRQNHGLHSLR